MTEVRVQSAALEDSPTRGGTIILRGVIAAEDLKNIQFGDYQRELMPLSSRESICNALKSGEALPDVELGMRGQRYRSRGNDLFLQDPVFGIDGKQRIETSKSFAALHPQSAVRLGVCIHFDTTEQWERERFHKLNANQRQVSPNVLLRNVRDQYRPVLMLYGLSHQQGFVLNTRVCWQQNMARGQLITALLYLKSCAVLHSFLGGGLSNSLKEILAGLMKLEGSISISHMRDNVGPSYNLIDECWGIRSIEYRSCAPHLRGTFLMVLARLLADYVDFWRSNKQLFIDAPMRRKIGQFPMADPQIKQLCSSSGQAHEMLYQLLLKHINSGKKSKRLTARTDVGARATRKETPQPAAPQPAPAM